MERKIKLLVCDDHTLFRQGIKASLSMYNDIEFVGEASDGSQLFTALQHISPDVILLDINMPIMDGVEALPKLKQEYSHIKVIILSMHNDVSMVSKMVALGADSYLTKGDTPELIYEATKAVMNDEVYFTPLMNRALLKATRENDVLKTKPIKIQSENTFVAPAPYTQVPKKEDDKDQMLQMILKKLNELETASKTEKVDEPIVVKSEEKEETIKHWHNPNMETAPEDKQKPNTFLKQLIIMAILAAMSVASIWAIVRIRTKGVAEVKTQTENKVYPLYGERDESTLSFLGSDIFGR